MTMDANILSDSDAGWAYIEHGEVETARLVLAHATGTPEHVLYEGEETPSVGDYDKDAYLNRYIDLQEDMRTLMLRIERGGVMIKGLKDDKYHAQCGNWIPREEYKALEAEIKDYEAHRSTLWSQWWYLKYQCDAIQEGCSSVYPRYKKILEDREDEKYDPMAHKKDAPEIDNRMLASDEAFFEGHMEEQEELFSYNRV